MKNDLFKAPYLGCAYYPEDWDESEQDYDIAMMKEAGINVARIAEFAWHNMEPEEGQFDFAWLHRVVNKLGDAGIAVVLGTPTATPPHWFAKKYPDALIQYENGRQASHGGRRHCCSNNANYRSYSARIVEKMGQEFGKHPYVIGWQIDNEIYCHDKGCFCPDCMKQFHDSLQNKYGTIEKLNKSWNLTLFSQAYDDFDTVPAPRDGWHNPHILQEWLIAQNESHVDFVHMQADILRKYTDVLVGTDTMPFNGMDYRKLNDKLDVVQFNHYHEPENLYTVALWFDYLRTLRPHPFWNTETSTSWNGGVTITQSIKPEGFCRVNSYLPLALGGEANMYWIWRTHWAGHELMHGSVLDASGRPMHIFGEVQDTAKLMQDTAAFLEKTKVSTKVGFHYSSLSWNMLLSQNVVEGISNNTVYDFYKGVLNNGLRPDVIDAAQPLDQYDLLFTPLMLTLEEGDLPERISEWVKNGGTWVVGPLSDVRNSDGARYQHKPFGILEELTGAKWLYGIPDRVGAVSACWTESGKPFSANTWYDIYDETPENTLVSITAGHSAINYKACVVHRQVGKGHVILLGTLPDADDLTKIYEIACGYAGIQHGNTGGEVMVIPRAGDEIEGLILIEYSGKNSGSYTLSEEMTDVVTGEKISGAIELQPYEIRVLRK